MSKSKAADAQTICYYLESIAEKHGAAVRITPDYKGGFIMRKAGDVIGKSVKVSMEETTESFLCKVGDIMR